MAHFSVASLTQVVWLLVFICWTPSSTGAAFSLEEEFLQLKENYIQMTQVVKSLEAKVEQLKSLESTAIEQQAKVTQLEAKMTQLESQGELNNEQRQDLTLKVTQLEVKNVQLEVKIEKLEAKVEQQDSLLTSLLREKNERTATNFNSVAISNNQSAVVSINGLPSSCGDLKMIGHIWSGIYSVMGLAKMESVYCDFTKLPEDEGFQIWIGYVDVKSAPVHFYVQRNSSFSETLYTNTPIPFDFARVNEGNAMDLTTGKFKAPRPGTYFFSFAGVARLESSSSYVQFNSDLFLNGKRIGASLVVENNVPVNQYSPMSLQSTLNLEKGDQVYVMIYYDGSSSYLFDDIYHRTHFTGFMLEEEIVASL
ncbi:uncharacterized protein LOC124336299 [Daphnia pulicaria]|uniref:uncharacterized protein LOC124336299 n=1 Tax=Daphnia pulicaria TaxID=35523 RepID=UPI001EEA803A|nr:uncharacterized protein LOC124336299 [Daphnia pulicaria]